MVTNGLLDMLNKEKIRIEKAKATRKFFVGMGIATVVGAGVATAVLLTKRSGRGIQINMKNKAKDMAEAINKDIQKKADTVKVGATHATKKVYRVIENVDRRIKGIKKDVKDVSHEVKQGIHETTKNIAKKHNGAVK